MNVYLDEVQSGSDPVEAIEKVEDVLLEASQLGVSSVEIETYLALAYMNQGKNGRGIPVAGGRRAPNRMRRRGTRISRIPRSR